MVRFGKTEDKSAHAMGNYMDRLTGKGPLGVPKHGVKIEATPVEPARIEAAKRLRA